MTTEREQILALAGEPTLAFRRRGQEDFCTCNERRYNELAQKPSLFEMRVFYTADQVIAARKPLEEEIERLKKSCQTPVPNKIAAQIERTDWTPEQALQFYADQHNFDIVEGRVRIIDNGAVASNALKHLTLDRLELKGDAELSELRQQLAEKDVEIEWLKEEGNMPVKYYQPNGKGQVYAVYGASSINFADFLLEKLAAAQLQIKQYREAFELQRKDKWHWQETRDKALALPQDTSALSALIAKAGEVMRERCCRKAESMERDYPITGKLYAGNVSKAIRSIPGVTIADLK